MSEKFEFLVVFDAIAVQFSRVSVISSNTISNKRARYALIIFKRRCSVLLQKHFRKTPCDFHYQKESKIFNIFVFVQLVFFLNRFGVRIMVIVQQSLHSYSSRVLKKYLRTLVGKWLNTDRKNSKMSSFFSVSFRLGSETFGEIKASKSSR